MKARMFVVNSATIQNTINDRVISVFVPQPSGKPLWNKTIIDIIADMLQVEIGDYIFLWETKDDRTKNRIYGVYRAVSNPYYQFSNGDDYPLKFKIEKAYEFENPISEYSILNDPYMKNNIWSIIGKKVAGKSRGSSPITQQETDFLIKKLIDVNPNFTFYEEYESQAIPEGTQEIILRLDKVCNITYNSLDEFDITEFGHRKSPNSRKVKYEKSLEAIMNNTLRIKNASILSSLGINVSKVKWYANYLPYSFEQSEIDYLIIESDDGYVNTRYTIIEFQKGPVDLDHIDRALLYSQWIRDNLCGGNNNLVSSKVIGFTLTDNVSEQDITELESKYSNLNVEIYSYKIKENSIEYKKER